MDIENKLFQGDSLEILAKMADEAVDAVITDPPYTPGAMPTSNFKGLKYPFMIGACRDQRSQTNWMWLWLSECYRITKNGGALLLFSDWRSIPLFSDVFQAAGWHWRSTVVWDKVNCRVQRGNFKHQAEFILFATKGEYVPPDVWLPGVYSVYQKTQDKNHIAGKPVELIEKLLKVLHPNSLVLDPFMGGGAVPKACIQTGHRYCGIELSKDYFQIASEFILGAEEKVA
jgi:site-specific DNA-methyltransferase (adenine-specific)